jgi:DNA topoisomerase IA
MESEYVTPGLGVTDKGLRVLDWLDRNAPWLTAETSKKLEELLENVREGKTTYQEVFDALCDFSASGSSRGVEIPKTRKDPALALRETVQTLYPTGSGGHSL